MLDILSGGQEFLLELVAFLIKTLNTTASSSVIFGHENRGLNPHPDLGFVDTNKCRGSGTPIQ
jgi:hypothetical protein